MSEKNNQNKPLQGVFDELLRQQVRRKRMMRDPITGEVFDMDKEKMSFETKLRDL